MPKSHTTPTTRVAIERLQRIDAELKNRAFPNATNLARTLEVSPRTIARDLEFMRERLGAPVAFDSHRNGYYYTREGYVVPSTQITAEDFAALLVAERALDALGPAPVASLVKNVRDRIAVNLPEEIRLSPVDQIALMEYRASAVLRPDDALLRRLANAITERSQLSIRYQSATRGGAKSQRAIDPYALVNQQGSTYMLAYCHSRERVCTFVPNRILDIAENGERFVRPPDFSIDKHLDNAFRVFVGQTPLTLRILFSEKVAFYIRERELHKSQKLVEHLGGRVELRVRATHLDEILRWALGWGADAEVLAPPRARTRMAELVRATAAKYARVSRGRPAK